MRRGALAGMAAAATWAAAEPLLQRALRTPYSDVRLLGGAITKGRLWWPAGLAVHLANGAVFGALFERVGGRGGKQGVLAAQLETAALWPAIALVDRWHPDRKSGAWPPLFRSPRVFLYEATMHAVFGIVLGVLLRDEATDARARR